MVKDNLKYLEIAENNPEDIFDEFYALGTTVIPESKKESNELVKAALKLHNLIKKFSECIDNRKYRNSSEVKNILVEIRDLLKKNKANHINYAPFCQYFMVYNSSFTEFLGYSDDDKINFLYKILLKYRKERLNTYVNYGFSAIPLQVLSDNYSSKKKSVAQIIKLNNMLKPYNLKEITDKDIDEVDFQADSEWYFTPDKKGPNLFEKFLKDLNIEMKSRKVEHNKFPDYVFKHNKDYYIFELKSIKGSGGHQDTTMIEVIRFISYSESNRNIHYCAFLDSSYANKIFLGKQAPKTKSHKEAIEDALSVNRGNYFLNTESAKQLFKDIFSVK